MIQTKWVEERLRSFYEDVDIEIIGMTTVGDRILDVSLHKVGEKSLFTKELEVALNEDKVDLVVHSLKDLPTQLPDNLTIGAICQREDARDVVIMRPDLAGVNLASLKQGSCVGTSSLRRVAQLTRRYPHLKFASIRGNLNTRLRKLDSSCARVTAAHLSGVSCPAAGDGGYVEQVQYSALVLAAAGVIRIGLSHRISEVLEPEVCLYAVGQGALAVECRSSDLALLKMLQPLCHWPTTLCCVAERSLLRCLDGGCSAPVGVHSDLTEDKLLRLTAGVWSLDGQQQIVHSVHFQLPPHCSLPSSEQLVRDGPISAEQTDYTCNNDAQSVHMYTGVCVLDAAVSRCLQCAQDLGISVAEELFNKGAANVLLIAKQTSAR